MSKKIDVLDSRSKWSEKGSEIVKTKTQKREQRREKSAGDTKWGKETQQFWKQRSLRKQDKIQSDFWNESEDSTNSGGINRDVANGETERTNAREEEHLEATVSIR
jgi:hypothetical protein